MERNSQSTDPESPNREEGGELRGGEGAKEINMTGQGVGGKNELCSETQSLLLGKPDTEMTSKQSESRVFRALPCLPGAEPRR